MMDDPGLQCPSNVYLPGWVRHARAFQDHDYAKSIERMLQGLRLGTRSFRVYCDCYICQYVQCQVSFWTSPRCVCFFYTIDLTTYHKVTNLDLATRRCEVVQLSDGVRISFRDFCCGTSTSFASSALVGNFTCVGWGIQWECESVFIGSTRVVEEDESIYVVHIYIYNSNLKSFEQM